MSEQSQTPAEASNAPRPAHSGDVVARARADIAASREWKARDRLTGHLRDHFDADALELLGEVHYAMRDLPQAGAAWFGTNRRGKDVDEAIEAWRERHGDDFVQMWRSLPRTVRERADNKRVEALRRRSEAAQPGVHPASGLEPARDSGGGGVDAAVVIAVALAVLLMVCAVIGFVTLLRWMVPG